MSSILKALKKLEQEKVTLAHDSLEIDTGILGNQKNTTPVGHFKFYILKRIFPAALIFICGSGATYIYLNSADRALKKQVSSISEIEKSIAVEVPAVGVPQAVVNIEKEPLYAVHLPLKKKRARPESEKLKRTVGPAPDISATATSNQEHSQKQQAPLVVGNVPLLQVNGIAFQTGGSDSAAIINGNNVTSGSSINGATVEEILEDRVRFKYKGENVEVLLGRSNQ